MKLLQRADEIELANVDGAEVSVMSTGGNTGKGRKQDNLTKTFFNQITVSDRQREDVRLRASVQDFTMLACQE